MSDLGQFEIDVENEAATVFEPLPEGDYVAIVTESELKDTKAGTGKILALTLQVMDGDHQGRIIWDNLNLQNPNPKCEQIGRAQLASLCKACGVANPTDSEELHNTPVVIRVKVDRNNNDKRVVKGYSAVGDAWEPETVPAAKGPADKPKPAAPSVPSVSTKKPWQKK